MRKLILRGFTTEQCFLFIFKLPSAVMHFRIKTTEKKFALLYFSCTMTVKPSWWDLRPYWKSHIKILFVNVTSWFSAPRCSRRLMLWWGAWGMETETEVRCLGIDRGVKAGWSGWSKKHQLWGGGEDKKIFIKRARSFQNLTQI